MSADLDRFDRMLIGVAPASPTRVTYRVPNAAATLPERQPVITSKREPRFVDKTSCPMCGVTELGIEYHGELLKGGKVHTLAAHTANMRRVQNGQPRCLGAGMRVVFIDGGWRGVVTP